jgi:hypothetical protein
VCSSDLEGVTTTSSLGSCGGSVNLTKERKKGVDVVEAERKKAATTRNI